MPFSPTIARDQCRNPAAAASRRIAPGPRIQPLREFAARATVRKTSGGNAMSEPPRQQGEYEEYTDEAANFKRRFFLCVEFFQAGNL
jgi:hypothetical protein